MHVQYVVPIITVVLCCHADSPAGSPGTVNGAAADEDRDRAEEAAHGGHGVKSESFVGQVLPHAVLDDVDLIASQGYATSTPSAITKHCRGRNWGPYHPKRISGSAKMIRPSITPSGSTNFHLRNETNAEIKARSCA